MVHTITASVVVALSLAAAAPAYSFSTIELEARERDAMLATCRQLPGADQTLCRDVVGDDNVIANTKRSCLHAMKAMLQGSAWATVRGLPDAMSCRSGLARAGYPVNSVMQRLAGAEASAR